MPWFVDTDDLKRQGARLLLLAMRNPSITQVALQYLDQDMSLDQVGFLFNEHLEGVFTQQTQQISQLQNDLAWQKNRCESLQGRAEQWAADPLQKQVAAAVGALEEKSRQASELSDRLTSLQETLARERSQHRLEVERLKDQVLEQNRLIAKQHNQLEQLTGANLPE